MAHERAQRMRRMWEEEFRRQVSCIHWFGNLVMHDCSSSFTTYVSAQMVAFD
jgi:hypothetical protein